MKPNLIIGIDVSKSQLDYVIVRGPLDWAGISQLQVAGIANEVDSIQLWLSGFSAGECLFVLEPTGSYSDKVLSLLSAGGHAVGLINPREAHHLAQLLGISNKTDAQSARMLAYYGRMGEVRLYQPPTAQMKARKRILTTLEGLLKQQQALRNQLHAQAQYYAPCSAATEALEAVLQTINVQISRLEKQLKQDKDQVYIQLETRIRSVSGVGPVIAQWLICLTDGLAHFHTTRQLVKWSGLAPGKHKSGSSVNRKASISKSARAKLRAALFMGAKSAIRFNHACKDLYQRLRQRGKTYHQAMVAVMAKLLKQIFGVVKNQTDFDNQYYLRFQRKPKKLVAKA